MGTNSYYVSASTVGQASKVVSKTNFKFSIIQFMSRHRWPTKTHLTRGYILPACAKRALECIFINIWHLIHVLGAIMRWSDIINNTNGKSQSKHNTSVVNLSVVKILHHIVPIIIDNKQHRLIIGRYVPIGCRKVECRWCTYEWNREAEKCGEPERLHNCQHSTAAAT